jgi:hypothetical protein
MEQKKLPADFWTRNVDTDPFARTIKAGATIHKIERHQIELGKIVEKMQRDLMNEGKILEGTEIPEREDIVIPPPENPEEVLKQIRLSPETESKK